MRSTWRSHCKPIIAAVLKATKDKSDKEIRKALIDAYPFGERAYHPYKIWLDEIKYQRGTKKSKQRQREIAAEGQGHGVLF